jgi:hypothetical protein
MNRLCTASAVAVLLVCGMPLARAVPPTVTPSPGYDARLQESRKATSSSTVVQPAPPLTTVPRHHKRKH